MARTTIDLDPTVLEALRHRSRRERKSMGTVASELLAAALETEGPDDRQPLRWRSQPMGQLVDIDDKEALSRILDGK